MEEGGIGKGEGIAEIAVQGVQNAVSVQVLSIQHPVAFGSVDLGIIAILVYLVAGQVVGVSSRLTVEDAVESGVLFQGKYTVIVFVLCVEHI